jgi:hypothetical protein
LVLDLRDGAYWLLTHNARYDLDQDAVRAALGD